MLRYARFFPSADQADAATAALDEFVNLEPGAQVYIAAAIAHEVRQGWQQMQQAIKATTDRLSSLEQELEELSALLLLRRANEQPAGELPAGESTDDTPTQEGTQPTQATP